MNKIIFLVAVALCLTPIVDPPIALFIGFVFSLLFKNPFADSSPKAINLLLKTSIVLLGFGMDINYALKTGKEGFFFTLFSIIITLSLGWILTKIIKTEKNTAYLISSGNAICGASAISAISSIIKADKNQISVSLAIVFMLNALALFIFPFIGHWFHLSQEQFGIWCGVAVHDTSSVVGVASKFGVESLRVATIIKLQRTLWIIPLSVFTYFIFKAKNAKINIPYFIGLFILAMCIRKGFTVSIFLIGAGSLLFVK